MKDIFALQDEIVRRIVTTLNLQLTLAQQGFPIPPRETDNLEAYDDMLRGLQFFLTFTKDGNAKARQQFEKAIALDPKYARAYAALGLNYLSGWTNLVISGPNELERAFQLEQRAIALDDSSFFPHNTLAGIYVQRGQFDQALIEAQRAVALNPNSAGGYFSLSDVLNNTARPGDALAAVQKAMRLDPRSRDRYKIEEGYAYTQLGRYEDAIPAFERNLAVINNNIWLHVLLVYDYMELGQEDAARAEATKVERLSTLNPNSPVGYAALSSVMYSMGEQARAVAAVEQAMRLNPGNGELYLLREGLAYGGLARYEESITALKGFLVSHPDFFWAHLGLAVDYIEIGQDDAARAEAAQVMRLNPQFYLAMVYRTVGPKGKVLAENIRWSADLRKAGLK
jgi:tetratricopeptide (TPR) repeat protein